MVRVGVIGLGHWGPNLVRNFNELPQAKVKAVCDVDLRQLQQVAARFPGLVATDDPSKIIDRDLIDAVVIATPTRLHYLLAKKALEQGIHTFVEKPLAKSARECEALIATAKANHALLFVGHVFLYNAAVIKLKELVNDGVLGRLCYISSDRLNLGPVRSDVSVLWDLAPHDVSIILHLVDSKPTSINCHGLAFLNNRIHDVCTLNMHFENGAMAAIRVSWLDPNKVRRMTVVGDKKMAVYDDIDPMEKVKVFDKGIDTQRYMDTFGEFQISYRYGDTYSPRIVEVEPLRAECEHFIECIQQGKLPRTGGHNGLEVVRVLEAADLSLKSKGAKASLQDLDSTHQLNGSVAREAFLPELEFTPLSS